MRFALIGQPNCGKSTLFNQVAGYKAETGNFSGTTVTFTESKVRVSGDVVDLVDLPGAYTLAGTNPAEREVLNYLTSREVDVVINVIDASHLQQGLTLTLELMELQRPLVVALNMMDEAARMGMKIDGPELSRRLGVTVLPLVASHGRGVRPLFVKAMSVAEKGISPTRPCYSRDIEMVIAGLAARLDGQGGPLSKETVAIKLLEEDRPLTEKVAQSSPELMAAVKAARQSVQEQRGQPSIWAISGERQALAANLSRELVEQGERRDSIRDKLDNILLHPVYGYLALIVILFLFFQVVYTLGSTLEKPLLAGFDLLNTWVAARLGTGSFVTGLVLGLLQGISGGVAIVIPYLMPFLLGLGLLEDIGYLPRVAFLMDALMHRMGLHGKAIVPFILGYGCNVPAVMSTRILEERSERFLAAALSTLVPCAARLSVVFGLVAFYLGPGIALVIYVFNLFVIALTARFLSRLVPEDTPGLILEMPVYRLPTVKTVFNKAWFRVREFIIEAWPLLIAGSAVLAVLNYFNWAHFFNLLVTPLSWVLGLPNQVGVPLIFGVLRKELSLIMLRQALGGVDFGVALSPVQMVTFTVFVVFYIPCLATLAAIRRELGTRAMLGIAGLTVVVATLAALVARGVAVLVVHFPVL